MYVHTQCEPEERKTRKESPHAMKVYKPGLSVGNQKQSENSPHATEANPSCHIYKQPPNHDGIMR